MNHPQPAGEPGSRLPRAGVLLVLAVVCSSATGAMAIGTRAGTDITSQATVTFTMDAETTTVVSNEVIAWVVQLLDVNLIWQDATPVRVAPGDTLRVLTFRVTNTGNGDDTLLLVGESNMAGDDFDPVLEGIFLDGNGNGVFDAASDPRYVSGTNDPALEPDAHTTIFALNDIPVLAGDGEEGMCLVRTASGRGSGAPGTVLPGGGEGGVDAIVGTSGGVAADFGFYLVSTVEVQVAKSATVADPFGGSEPISGAVITYRLVVTVLGSGTAQDVTIVDPVPAHTIYREETLYLNAAQLTDEADLDPGDVDAKNPGAVTVLLGNLTDASPGQIITFDVTIE